METVKPACESNIPSIAIGNVADTEAILKRVTTIRNSLLGVSGEKEPVERKEPRSIKDLLQQERFALQEIMNVISEIEEELL